MATKQREDDFRELIGELVDLSQHSDPHVCLVARDALCTFAMLCESGVPASPPMLGGADCLKIIMGALLLVGPQPTDADSVGQPPSVGSVN